MQRKKNANIELSSSPANNVFYINCCQTCAVPLIENTLDTVLKTELGVGNEMKSSGLVLTSTCIRHGNINYSYCFLSFFLSRSLQPSDGSMSANYMDNSNFLISSLDNADQSPSRQDTT